MNSRTINTLTILVGYGITVSDAVHLIKLERKLRRLHERQCSGDAKILDSGTRYAITVAVILSQYNIHPLTYHIQSAWPHDCALYIIRKSDIPAGAPDDYVCRKYASIGVAVQS